jgi:hypothetical protein
MQSQITQILMMREITVTPDGLDYQSVSRQAGLSLGIRRVGEGFTVDGTIRPTEIVVRVVKRNDRRQTFPLHNAVTNRYTGHNGYRGVSRLERKKISQRRKGAKGKQFPRCARDKSPTMFETSIKRRCRSIAVFGIEKITTKTTMK